MASRRTFLGQASLAAGSASLLPAIVPAIALLLALTTGCRSGDYNARVFHPWGCEDARDFKAHVDKYQHVFMVCIYEDHWEDEGPKRHSVYHFKGTVVRVYKGDWRISEKGAFLQGMDYPAPTTSNEAAGSLWFVFTGQHADTEIFLDTGELSRYDAEYEPALERLYPRNMSPVWRGQSSRAQSRESDNTTTWLD